MQFVASAPGAAEAPAGRPARLSLLFVLALAPAGASRGADSSLRRTEIQPKLDPTSHKIFFDKDYPDNLAPKGQVKTTFKHPYPIVQDSEDYDKDYPKDENADNGEWKAQLEYDLLRTKMSKEEDDKKHAKATVEEARKKLEEARKREEEAARKAKEAKGKVGDLEDALERAKREAEEALSQGKNGTGADGEGSVVSVESRRSSLLEEDLPAMGRTFAMRGR